MKKNLCLVLFAVIAIVFTSCSKDDENNPSENYPSIIGSWSEVDETDGEYLSSTMEVTWTFKADNTANQRVILIMNNVTMRDVTNSYSYVYKGKTIVFKGEKTTFEYEVNVSGNKMKLGNADSGYFNLTKK